jgi:hypothetical protein
MSGLGVSSYSSNKAQKPLEEAPAQIRLTNSPLFVVASKAGNGKQHR